MKPAVQRVLARLEERSRQETALRKSLSEREYRSRLDEFMLPVGPESGRFLNLLIKLGRCTRVLELGTSVGYSALWMAEALEDTGGRMISIDRQASKLAEARTHLSEAGLLPRVELIAGDILQTLAGLPGPFDLVLLDYTRDQFIAALDALLPKLAPGALVVADNMIEPAATRAQAEAYRAHVARQPGLETVLVPIGNGMELTRKGP